MAHVAHARAHLIEALLDFSQNDPGRLFPRFLVRMSEALAFSECHTCRVELDVTSVVCTACRVATFCSQQCAEHEWSEGRHHARFCQRHVAMGAVLFGPRKPGDPEDEEESDNEEAESAIVSEPMDVVDTSEFELFFPQVVEAANEFTKALAAEEEDLTTPPSTPPRKVLHSPVVPPAPRKRRRTLSITGGEHWEHKHKKARSVVPSSFTPATIEDRQANGIIDQLLDPILNVLYDFCRIDPSFRVAFYALLVTCKAMLGFAYWDSERGVIKDQFIGFWTYKDLALAALMSTSPTFAVFLHENFIPESIREKPTYRAPFLTDEYVGLAVGLAGADQETANRMLADTSQLWHPVYMGHVDLGIANDLNYYKGLLLGRHMTLFNAIDAELPPHEEYKRWGALQILVEYDMLEVVYGWTRMLPAALKVSKATGIGIYLLDRTMSIRSVKTWDLFMVLYGEFIPASSADLSPYEQLPLIFGKYKGNSAKERLELLRRKIALMDRFPAFNFYFDAQIPPNHWIEIWTNLRDEERTRLLASAEFNFHHRLSELLLESVLPRPVTEEDVQKILYFVSHIKKIQERDFLNPAGAFSRVQHRFDELVEAFVDRGWSRALAALRDFLNNSDRIPNVVFLHSEALEKVEHDTALHTVIRDELGFTVMQLPLPTQFWSILGSIMDDPSMPNVTVAEFITRQASTKAWEGLTTEAVTRVVQGTLRRGREMVTAFRVIWHFLQDNFFYFIRDYMGKYATSRPVFKAKADADDEAVDWVRTKFGFEVQQEETRDNNMDID